MIHIEKDQLVPENKDLQVFALSGDYSDNDLIECYNISDPSLPVSSLQAQFIKYGGIVYQYNTPEELGAALVKIDPASTHDSAVLFKEDEARRLKRMSGTLEPENAVPVDPEVSPIAQEQIITENTASSTPSTTSPSLPESTPTTASTTPIEIPTETATSTNATSTVSVLGETTSTTTSATNTSTTTTASIPEIIENVGTTTENIINALENISDTMPTSTAPTN